MGGEWARERPNLLSVYAEGGDAERGQSSLYVSTLHLPFKVQATTRRAGVMAGEGKERAAISRMPGGVQKEYSDRRPYEWRTNVRKGGGKEDVPKRFLPVLIDNPPPDSFHIKPADGERSAGRPETLEKGKKRKPKRTVENYWGGGEFHGYEQRLSDAIRASSKRRGGESS